MSEYVLEKWSPQEWGKLSEKAHLVSFGEDRPEQLNTHHFIMVVKHQHQLGGYFTCLEMDANTLYIQYGATFPNFQKTVHAVRGFAEFIQWCRTHYARFWARIENVNLAMLKLAMHEGFLITGISYFKNKTYLELYQEVV